VSDPELEWRLVYSMIVAGKSAKFADTVMGRIDAELSDYRSDSLFQKLRYLMEKDRLHPLLLRVRTGNYTKILTGLIEILKGPEINLRTVTPEELETYHGIGPKTARFFVIWTRPDAVYAALDVHVLRWLRAQGHDAPKSTPSGAKYRALELIFIEEAAKRGMTPRELDYQIWAEGSGYQETTRPTEQRI
jgi:thermostable 8-oxoguanine DNA glycosylase